VLTLTQTETAYLAGIIDGEGCIRIQRNCAKRIGARAPQYALALRIGSNDPRLMLWLQEHCGGSYYQRADKLRRHIYFEWVVSSLLAQQVLELVLPHLLLKADQARLGLAFQSGLSKNKKKQPLSEVELEAREQAFDAMKQLKREPFTRVLQ
jgi:hypothetical protein